MLDNIRDWSSFIYTVHQMGTPEESIRLMLESFAQKIEHEIEGEISGDNLAIFAEGLRGFSDDLVRAIMQKKRDVIELPDQS